MRHPETGLWSHEPGTSFPCEKSVQKLNRVVDWFDINNNTCGWIVTTAASRGTQNCFSEIKDYASETTIAQHQLSGIDFWVQTKLTFRQYLTLNVNTCNRESYLNGRCLVFLGCIGTISSSWHGSHGSSAKAFIEFNGFKMCLRPERKRDFWAAFFLIGLLGELVWHLFVRSWIPNIK